MCSMEEIVDVYKTNRGKYINFIQSIERKFNINYGDSYAEDILHQSLLTILSTNIDEIRNINSYINTSIHNQTLDLYRKITNPNVDMQCFSNITYHKNLTSSIGDLDIDDIMYINMDAKYKPVMCDIDKKHTDAEFSDLLNTAISKLKDRDREIFIKNKYENITNKELSKEYGLTINGTLAVINRAKQKIKENVLVEIGNEIEDLLFTN